LIGDMASVRWLAATDNISVAAATRLRPRTDPNLGNKILIMREPSLIQAAGTARPSTRSRFSPMSRYDGPENIKLERAK
jgi:hypothetical protein